MAEIFSLEIEKSVIAGVLQHSEWIFDVEQFLSNTDFYTPSHQTIYNVIKGLLDRKETVTKEIVAEKIKNLGIILEVPAYDYLRALNVYSINKEGFVQSVKELKKLSVRREIAQTGIKIASEMAKCGNLSYDEIVSRAEHLFIEKINVYENSNEPVDLFKNLEEAIERIGNNPVDEIGLKSPYPIFNKMYGGLIKGDLYIFMALAKIGKTTLLNDFLWKTCTIANFDKKVRALAIDTEMESDRIRTRNVSSLSSVNEWLIKTGNFRKNPVLVEKVRAIWPRVKLMEEKVDHIYVGNMPIDEVCSIARRWHHKNIKSDEEGILCYDYMKITGETISDAHKEYQVIGNKTDALKKLGSELKVPVLCAVQTNAQGGVSQSQRISWFCSALFALEKKDPAEIVKYGKKWGTHKLVHKYLRNLGQYGDLASTIVTMTDDKGDKKHVENYINLNIENFNVTECGTLQDMVCPQIKIEEDVIEELL